MAGIDTIGDDVTPSRDGAGDRAASTPSRIESLGAMTDAAGDDATLAGDGPSLRVEDEAIGQAVTSPDRGDGAAEGPAGSSRTSRRAEATAGR